MVAFKNLSILSCIVALSTLAMANRRMEYNTRPREGHYIVVLKEHVDPQEAFEHMTMVEARKYIHFDWAHTTVWDPPRLFSVPEADGTPMIGYSVRLSPDQVKELEKDDMVEYVERDQIITVRPVDDHRTASSGDTEAERKSTWALSRVTHRAWDDAVRNESTFRYDDKDGEGVTAYVIDTGVNIRHSEFEGRASYGKSFVRENDGSISDPEDGNGHGSHVASLIAGKTYGVAPKAKIVAVRVLDEGGSGSMSDVIAGISWVAKEHIRKGRKSLDVINLSLGSMKSETTNRAVNGAVAAGVHVVVASGNSHDDACDYSPASAKDVISVGATTFEDELAFFSNYGKCVHALAPGHKITGAWLGDDVQTISGTSMASPMIAGVVSTLLSREGQMKPKKMRSALARIGTLDAIRKLPDGTPNVLGYTCFGEKMDDCHDTSRDDSRDRDEFSFFDIIGSIRNVQRQFNRQD